MKETEQDIHLVSSRLRLKPSSLSPSAPQTLRASPVRASVGCNLKPGALGSKAKTFLSSQKSRMGPGCQCSSVPPCASFSTLVNRTSPPEALHIPAVACCVVFPPTSVPQNRVDVCVLQSLDSVKPQDVPGSSKRAEGWEPSQKTSRPSWPYLLKEPIALCSLKCGDTVDS